MTAPRKAPAKPRGSAAIEELPAKIVGVNSAEVDTISGCTVTSTAVIRAAGDALA